MEQELRNTNGSIFQRDVEDDFDPPVLYVIGGDGGIQQSLEWLLDATGYQVKQFSSVADFLAAYDNGTGCLMLDYNFLGMYGLRLTRELLWRRIDLPVIMLIEKRDAQMEAEAMSAGVIGFIEKPCNVTKLTELVRSAVEENLWLREIP